MRIHGLTDSEARPEMLSGPIGACSGAATMTTSRRRGAPAITRRQPSSVEPTYNYEHWRKCAEAKTIFEYLWKSNVSHVFTVEVPDCPVHPDSNSAIKASLDGLHVRKLVWRKLDVSTEILIDAALEIEAIRLYSSGNPDVLNRWCGYEGLYRHQRYAQSFQITSDPVSTTFRSLILKL